MKTPATTALPTSHESELAKECSREISAYLQTDAESQLIEIKDQEGISHSVNMPVSALKMLVNILIEVGDGNIVKIVPVHAELTTQEAADILNVSRPYFVGLLDKGEIPYRKLARHRRVLYKDVVKYKEETERKRSAVLDELASEAQELNLL